MSNLANAGPSPAQGDDSLGGGLFWLARDPDYEHTVVYHRPEIMRCVTSQQTVVNDAGMDPPRGVSPDINHVDEYNDFIQGILSRPKDRLLAIFGTLLSKSLHPATEDELRSLPEFTIPELTPDMIRHDEIVAAINRKRSLLTLDIITRVAVGGGDPQKFFEDFTRGQTSMCCTAVWTPKSMFYRCRDCGLTPSSSLCVHCFKAGDHEGHDFSIDRSRYGGCCDCGTEAAWKKSGFCTNHTGSDPGHDPSSLLPPDVKDRLSIAIEAVSGALLALLTRKDAEGSKMSSPLPGDVLATELTSWLRHLTRSCDAYRAVACDVWVDKEFTLPFLGSFGPRVYTLTNELTNLHLDMLYHTPYKKPFSHAFLRVYPLLLKGAPLDTHHGTWCKMLLEKTSVQLFNVKELTLSLSRNDQLMHMLWQTVTSQLRSALAPRASRQSAILRQLTPSMAQYLDRPWYILCTDIATAITHPEVAALHWDNQALTRSVFEFISLFQGMHEQQRRPPPLPHIEFESNAYIRSFNVQLDIARLVSSLLKGYKAGHVTESKFQQALKYWEGALLTNIASFHTPWDQSKPFGYPALEHYSVALNPVSFHHPLHHVYAVMVSAFLPVAEALDDVLPSRPQHLLLLVELPLRVTVLCAHIRARMWVRNGEHSLSRQAAIYRTSHLSREFWVYDLALLQSATLVLGGRHMYLLMRQRFELDKSVVLQRFSQHDMSDVEPYTASVANSFFETIISVWSELFHFGGPQARTALRRSELIHRLALGAQTHSSLTDALSRQALEGQDDLREMLSSISRYTPPTEKHEATFTLLPELYAEIDPFYHRYNRGDVEVAWENYDNIYGKEKEQHILLQPVHQVFDVKEHVPHLKLLTSVLRVPELHYALYSALWNAAAELDPERPSNPTAPLSNETLLSTVLRLLVLVLHEDTARLSSAADGTDDDTDNTGSRFIEQPPSMVPYVSESILVSARKKLEGMCEGVSLIHVLVQLLLNQNVPQFHRDAIPHILRLIAVDDLNKHVIVTLLSAADPPVNIFSSGVGSGGAQTPGAGQAADGVNSVQSPEEEEREKRRAAIKARQAKIQAQMKMNMEVFEQANDVSQLSENSGRPSETSRRNTMEDAELLCCLCRDEDRNGATHYLGLLSSTNVPKHVGYPSTLGNVASDSTDPATVGRHFIIPCDSEGYAPLLVEPIGINANFLQTCDHAVHLDCFNRFQENQAEQVSYEFGGHHDPVDFTQFEYMCPVCKRLCNTLVPAVSTVADMYMEQSIRDDGWGDTYLGGVLNIPDPTRTTTSTTTTTTTTTNDDDDQPASQADVVMRDTTSVKSSNSTGTAAPVTRPHIEFDVDPLGLPDVDWGVRQLGKMPVPMVHGQRRVRELVENDRPGRGLSPHLSTHALYHESYRHQRDTFAGECGRFYPCNSDPINLWPLGLCNIPTLFKVIEPNGGFTQENDLLCAIGDMTFHGYLAREPPQLNMWCKQAPSPILAWNTAAATLTCLEIAQRGNIEKGLLVNRREKAAILSLLRIHETTFFETTAFDELLEEVGGDPANDPCNCHPEPLFARCETSLLVLLVQGHGSDGRAWCVEMFPVLVRLSAVLLARDTFATSKDLCCTRLRDDLPRYLKLCYLRVVEQACMHLPGSDQAPQRLARILPFLRQSTLLFQALDLLPGDCVARAYKHLDSVLFSASGDDLQPHGGNLDDYSWCCESRVLLQVLGLSYHPQLIYPGATSGSSSSSLTPTLRRHGDDGDRDMMQGEVQYMAMGEVLSAEQENFLLERRRSLSQVAMRYRTAALPAPMLFTFDRSVLPHAYLDLVEKVYNQPCSNCHTIPAQPGLCLLCGQLLCINSACCRSVRRDNNLAIHEAYTHAQACFDGVGIVLNLNAAVVHVLRDNRQAELRRLYVDEYGQPDKNLVRGRPLFLQEAYLAQLTQWIVNHELDRVAAVLDISAEGAIYL